MSSLVLSGEFIFNSSMRLQVLNHVEHGLVFSAFSVAEKLGFKDSHDAVKQHCKRLLKLDSGCTPEINNIEGLSVTRGITLIKESDLYRLIMKSTLPKAEDFQDWVCEEVLPAIRKTGSYSVHKTPLALGVKKQLEIYETFLSSNCLKDIQEFAAAYDKYGLGRNNVFNLLRDLKIIQKGKTMPYRKYLKQKYFKVYFCNDEFFNNKTVLTPKGVRWLSEVIENHMETVRLVTGQKTLLDY